MRFLALHSSFKAVLFIPTRMVVLWLTPDIALATATIMATRFTEIGHMADITGINLTEISVGVMVGVLVGLDIMDGEADMAGMAEVLAVDIMDGEADMAGAAEVLAVDIKDGEVDMAGTAEVWAVDIKDGEADTAGTVEALAVADIRDGAGGMVDAEVI